MKNFSYNTETHRLSDGNKSGKPFQISHFSQTGKKLENLGVYIGCLGRAIHWICQCLPHLWSQIFQPLLVNARMTPFGHKRHISPLMAIFTKKYIHRHLS